MQCSPFNGHVGQEMGPEIELKCGEISIKKRCFSPTDYMKSVLDAVETEHEQNQRLGKRGLETVPQRQSIRPEDLLYDDPSDETFDTGDNKGGWGSLILAFHA